MLLVRGGIKQLNGDLEPHRLNVRVFHDEADLVDGRLPFRLLVNKHDLEGEPVPFAGDLQSQVEHYGRVLAA